MSARRFNPKRRTLLLSLVSAIAASMILTVRKLVQYAAAPAGEKESDFVFPPSADQTLPTRLTTRPAPADLPLVQRGGFINDASHLNRTAVYGIVKVGGEHDVGAALQFARDNGLKVTAAGQRHSMGGQTFVKDGLVLEMRGLNRITLDKAKRIVNVQSGAIWAEVQQLLDREGLSVKAMQSINIFSVGGTLSVNAHGIAHRPGPIALTVKAVRVMMSDGKVKTATPTLNAELFRHVLGGYGLFGIILDVDLEVVENEMYSRRTTFMDYREFADYYRQHVDGNDTVGLVYGRLSVSPSSYLREAAIHVYERTTYRGPIPPLTPDSHDALKRLVINFSKTGGLGRRIRWALEKSLEPRLHTCVPRNQAMTTDDACLVSRNQEMYDSMQYLENRLPDTDILQEYFVPYDRIAEFVDGLRTVVQRNSANLLNVTIRIVHKDDVTALPYARQDMFALVLYFNVGFNERESLVLQRTTRDLIDVALGVNGTYYLPYQLFYSSEQLRRAYPEVDRWFAAKRTFDPLGLLTNKFYDKYGAS
jgi:FAD/FMN-containing dehydrogenase